MECGEIIELVPRLHMTHGWHVRCLASSATVVGEGTGEDLGLTILGSSSASFNWAQVHYHVENTMREGGLASAFCEQHV